MAILPNDIGAATVIDNVTLNQNFEALETAIEGNLTEANLSSATRVPNSYLANNDFVFVLNRVITAAELNAQTAIDGTRRISLGSVPYDASDTAMSAYTLVSIETSTMLNGGVIAAVQPIFKAQIGNTTDGWVDISGATGITFGTTTNEARVSVNQALSGANYASRPYFLALIPTTASTSATADAESSFIISLKLKRELRS